MHSRVVDEYESFIWGGDSAFSQIRRSRLATRIVVDGQPGMSDLRLASSTKARPCSLTPTGDALKGSSLYVAPAILERLLLDHAGFDTRDFAVGELVGEKPLLIEAFDLSQPTFDR